MVPVTLSDFVSHLRGRAFEAAGTLYGLLLVRLSLPTLQRLARCGVPLASWAVFARELELAQLQAAERAVGTELERAIERDERAWRELDRRAELERLELELVAATDEPTRIRLLEQLARLEVLPVLLCALLFGCAPAAELEPAQGDAGDVDVAELEQPDATALELDGSKLEQDSAPAKSVLELEHARCAGAWADRDDSSTRYTAHPDTGLCTIACVWQEPRCHESWYGDPRCFPAHAARLEQLCAELGGECLEASDGVRYCEAL